MKRHLIIMAVSALVLLLISYVAAGIYVYNKLSQVAPKCGGNYANNTPTSFTLDNIEVAPYLMKSYENVSFPSRDANLTINGWYVPANSADPSSAPAVIIVHGLGACKHNPASLLPAGMLARNGFNVLLIDLRNQGDSQIEDGRYSAGIKEHRDVLGAWDWLIDKKGIPANRIGLFGYSLGAATALIAMGEEPKVAATWEDSSFADLYETIKAELTRNHYPMIIAPAGIIMGRLIGGVDITLLSPLGAIAKLNGRPVYITHGDADSRLGVQYAYDLASAIKAKGWTVDPWIVHGSNHVGAMFNHPDEYETRLVTFFKDALKAS